MISFHTWSVFLVSTLFVMISYALLQLVNIETLCICYRNYLHNLISLMNFKCVQQRNPGLYIRQSITYKRLYIYLINVTLVYEFHLNKCYHKFMVDKSLYLILYISSNLTKPLQRTQKYRLAYVKQCTQKKISEIFFKNAIFMPNKGEST
jgi:hypothetical protein